MRRNRIRRFQDIPNVGPVIAKELVALGLKEPAELIGKDPYQLYRDVCAVTREKKDPCVIDILISAVRYMEGGPIKKWWEFTEERKKHFGN
jgi:hypothetical protein